MNYTDKMNYSNYIYSSNPILDYFKSMKFSFFITLLCAILLNGCKPPEVTPVFEENYQGNRLSFPTANRERFSISEGDFLLFGNYHEDSSFYLYNSRTRKLDSIGVWPYLSEPKKVNLNKDLFLVYPQSLRSVDYSDINYFIINRHSGIVKAAKFNIDPSLFPENIPNFYFSITDTNNAHAIIKAKNLYTTVNAGESWDLINVLEKPNENGFPKQAIFSDFYFTSKDSGFFFWNIVQDRTNKLVQSTLDVTYDGGTTIKEGLIKFDTTKSLVVFSGVNETAFFDKSYGFQFFTSLGLLSNYENEYPNLLVSYDGWDSYVPFSRVELEEGFSQENSSMRILDVNKIAPGLMAFLVYEKRSEQKDGGLVYFKTLALHYYDLTEGKLKHRKAITDVSYLNFNDIYPKCKIHFFQDKFIVQAFNEFYEIKHDF